MNLPLEIQQFPADIFSDYVKLTENFEQVVFTGSRAMGGWSDKSDYDFVVARGKTKVNVGHLGYRFRTQQGIENYEGEEHLTSYRKGAINLLVMEDPDKLDDWAVATDYCIEHGISERPARIAAFRRLMPWREE